MSYRDRVRGKVDGPILPIHGYVFHQLLIQLLTGKYTGDTIISIWAGDSIKERMHLSLDDKRPGIDDLDINQEEYDRLIGEAVEANEWVHRLEKALVIEEILRGCEDTVCTLLICLCPNLVALLIPYGNDYQNSPSGFSRVTLTIIRITQAYNERTGADDHSIPLKHLKVIYTPCSNGEFSCPLAEVPYLLGMPSLELLVMRRAFWQGEFHEWPTDAPNPTCSNVYIDEGCLPPNVVKELAKGWKKPCVIRQIYGSVDNFGLNPSGEYKPEWRSCHVSFTTAGKRKIEFDLDPKPPLDDDYDSDDEDEARQEAMCRRLGAQENLYDY